MAKRKEAARVAEILPRLDAEYGTDLRCYLTHQDPWQLLMAVILSAQCTDARVNLVTPALFEAYPDAAAMAGADLADVERLIHSVGFYHNKALSLIGASRAIVERFNGEVPRSLEDLTSLPGVGRKTANVIRGNVYGDASIVVDTHVGRISRKLGLTRETDPQKVEFDLMKVLPEDHWILYNLHLITLGRTICTARSPRCGDCFLRECCPSAK